MRASGLFSFWREQLQPTVAPEVRYIYHAELIRCVDGDTLEIMCDRGYQDQTRMMVRLLHCDAPEPRGVERAAGEWVEKQVISWFGDKKKIVVESFQAKSSFGRYLFRVWLGDHELSAWLLLSGYAWPTDDQGKIIGPRDIERLSIPDGIKQQVRESLA